MFIGSLFISFEDLYQEGGIFMRKNGSLSVSMLSRASLIAAIYVCLTYIWPFSFGPVQVRISEAKLALSASVGNRNL